MQEYKVRKRGKVIVMPDKKKGRTISISLSLEDSEWLKKHPFISASGLFRECLTKLKLDYIAIDLGCLSCTKKCNGTTRLNNSRLMASQNLTMCPILLQRINMSKIERVQERIKDFNTPP